MALRLTIETEKESDGRWIAEAIGLAGVVAYGSNEEEAIRLVEALAFRVLADRIESSQETQRDLSVSFICA